MKEGFWYRNHKCLWTQFKKLYEIPEKSQQKCSLHTKKSVTVLFISPAAPWQKWDMLEQRIFILPATTHSLHCVELHPYNCQLRMKWRLAHNSHGWLFYMYSTIILTHICSGATGTNSTTTVSYSCNYYSIFLSILFLIEIVLLTLGYFDWHSVLCIIFCTTNKADKQTLRFFASSKGQTHTNVTTSSANSGR